jgi:hypothetical protein
MGGGSQIGGVALSGEKPSWGVGGGAGKAGCKGNACPCAAVADSTKLKITSTRRHTLRLLPPSRKKSILRSAGDL